MKKKSTKQNKKIIYKNKKRNVWKKEQYDAETCFQVNGVKKNGISNKFFKKETDIVYNNENSNPWMYL